VLAVCEVVRPAVVLGSAQRDTAVDAGRVAAAGFDVVRRRSGGGAVLLEPGRLVWIDVTVPAGDPLWVDDVGRAFEWLGDAWAGVLRSLGVDEPDVHRGGLVKTQWSREVCFAGLGRGEVRVGGRKVVGLSQRRTRQAALFQCACLLQWDPAPLVDVLVWPDGVERSDVVPELAGVAAGLHDLGVSVTAPDVEAAITEAIHGL
jgi:lipoate-protein ligase A